MYNLIWFCKKVNIPFEVYAFTLECNSYIDIQPNHPPIYKKVDGIVAPEKSFRLMNFFTSKTSTRELDEQMKHIWAACTAFQKGGGGWPSHLDLSGSPLGDSMLALHALIPDFQKKNKLQKVNVVFLTDGEGYVNSTTTMKKNSTGNYVGFIKFWSTTIRNKKNGRIYPAYEYGNFPKYSKILLSTLKDKFPTVNFINFRVVPSKDFRTCYTWYGNNEYGDYENTKKIFSKNQFITFKGSGYDQFNVIPTSSLSQSEEFVVDNNASKAQIKNAFTKMLSAKKTNKKLLSSFVELIA
jgi:hypothetical protein